MALDSEQIIRKAYQIAEDKDLAGWAAAFTGDGTFTDFSIGVTWRGPGELPEQVGDYARAFPDMHRELYQLYVSGDIVVVGWPCREPTSARCTCPPGRCGRPAGRLTPPAVTSSNWPVTRSGASTATPKARSS